MPTMVASKIAKAKEIVEDILVQEEKIREAKRCVAETSKSLSRLRQSYATSEAMYNDRLQEEEKLIASTLLRIATLEEELAKLMG